MIIIGSGLISISEDGETFREIGIADSLKYIDTKFSAEVWGALWEAIPEIREYEGKEVQVRVTHKEVISGMKMKTTQYDFFQCRLEAEKIIIDHDMKKEGFEGKCFPPRGCYPVSITSFPDEDL